MSTPTVDTLAAMLDDAASTDAEIVILPEDQRTDVGHLWERSRHAVASVSDHERIACSLSSSIECLTVLLAAIRAGTDVVSLPLPPRGSPVEDYHRFVTQVVAQTGAGAVFLDDALLDLVPPLAVPTVGYATTASAAPVDGDGGDGFTLVQYTSGSTGDPKGIVLPESSILANVDAVRHRLATEPSDVLCSWLPLSHDMGLIGTLFTALRTIAGAGQVTGRMVFLQPEWFVRRPASWLEAVSHHRATITAGPDFGYQRSIRADFSGDLDLSSLRVAIVGAEPVRADTLRRFEETFGPAGFGPSAFTPAYGLAESALAVTLIGADDRWTSLTLDARALERGAVVPVETNGVELVSCGAALEGHHVDIRSTDDTGPVVAEVGRIAVAGPSLMARYADGRTPFDAAGALLTEDLGVLREGELHVTGRRDDVMMIAGRGVNAIEVQRAAGVPGVRPGTEVAVVDPTQSGFVVVVEADDDVASLGRLAQTIRGAVSNAVAAAPNAVLIVASGTVPRTASGKPRRSALELRLRTGEVELRETVRFR